MIDSLPGPRSFPGPGESGLNLAATHLQLTGKTMIFGHHDENTLVQFRDVASRAVGAALMADGHFGYIMPVGGVTAYRNQVSIAGVGYDIGCGNTAIRTDLQVDDLMSCTRAEIEANPV